MEPRRTRQRWTYAEFARLPTSGSTRYEIIDGELVVTPAPGLKHQRIVTRLVSLLHAFARTHALGEAFVSPYDVLFAEGDYLEPDLLFVRKARAELVTDRGVEGAPDLVVEILSPSTAARDHGIKLERYRHHGVPEYWIVDPEEGAIEVWQLAEGAREALRFDAVSVLRWAPAGSGPSLDIVLAELFAAE
jgi:Uma2 family endonuclease